MSGLNTILSVLLGSLFAAAIVAFLTQRLIEQRERRAKRDQLRLDLYLDIVDLVLENELAITMSTSGGENPPVELQARRIRASHRLKLLGSARVKEAYRKYSHLVFQETALPRNARPADPEDVVRARDALIAAMANDVQEEKGPIVTEQHNDNEKQSEPDWLSYYLHQDSLQWGRLQTLGITQLGVLGAAYAIRGHKPVSLGLIALGAILSLLVFFLFMRDQEYRFAVRKKVRDLEEFEQSVPRTVLAPLTGRIIAWILFASLFAADLCLALLILFGYIP